MTALSAECLTAELPRHDVPQAVLLDWDRTLGHVDGAMNRLRAVVTGHGVDGAILEDVLDIGGVEEPLSALASRLSTRGVAVTLEHIRAGFMEMTSHSVIYPDAPALMNRIESSGAPHMILTYGHEEWQNYKIQGAPCGTHFQVLDHSNKGPHIERMRSPDGTYDFYALKDGKPTAVYRAQSVALVDDRVVSLQGLPEGCTGYLLRRPGEKLKANQLGEWPSEFTIASLGQLVMQDGLLVSLPQPVTELRAVMSQPQITYRPVRVSAA